ncbi:MAG TPA: DUF2256 domain-containing protein [Gammaproteobacteria bacterium]|nr:MAG: DUF2256 domain-containing protein [OM182 bacterium]HAL42149.1 DUF2256 domain-containing protein [Gammaproteobacteria bacterium]HBK17401.1 DUF2256 domain-containing protein [Gammaproteobacteria bacterium]
MGKSELPQKNCIVCSRPYAWRKKWARDWEQVKYCSERCRRSAKTRREKDA